MVAWPTFLAVSLLALTFVAGCAEQGASPGEDEIQGQVVEVRFGDSLCPFGREAEGDRTCYAVTMNVKNVVDRTLRVTVLNIAARGPSHPDWINPYATDMGGPGSLAPGESAIYTVIYNMWGPVEEIHFVGYAYLPVRVVPQAA